MCMLSQWPACSSGFLELSDGERARQHYGAWWLLFALGAVLSALCALPMACFARKLPGVDKLRQKDISQVNVGASYHRSDEDVTAAANPPATAADTGRALIVSDNIN